MKNGMRNVASSSTGDISNNKEITTGEVSSSISSSPVNKTQELITSPKKELSYIFKLNVTKKKLENIEKRIDKLHEKMNKLQALYIEKTSLIDFHIENIYISEMEFEKQLSALKITMKENKISNISFITDLDKQATFLRRHMNSYLKHDIVPLLKTTKETDEQKIQNTMNSLLSQERQRIQQILDSLYNVYFTLEVEKHVLKVKREKFAVLKKEVEDLKTQIVNLTAKINKENELYDQIHQHGFIKGYESSGAKVPIQDMVAPDHIISQMKKLITISNNPSDTKKFGIPLPKGVLFVGKPETGKTFAAKVLASEIDRKMYHIKAHDLFSENSVDPNQMLYIIFYSIIDRVQKTSESCVIFLDEIEKMIDSMGEYNPAEQKIIANTLIKNIINIQKSDLDILIVAALGQKNKIDPRFMKYDIFDNQFFFELPKEEERKKLFQLYISKAEKRAKLKLFDQTIIDELVKKTEGFSAEYIKQLVTSCVKEYLYSYLNKKPSFDIDKEYIGNAVGLMKELHTTNPSKKNILSLGERQKIVSSFIMKYMIFGLLDTKEKIDDIKNCILDTTKNFSEIDMKCFLDILLAEYQRKKSEYHRQSLIQTDFILNKIQELKDEDKLKGNSSYFSR